MVTVFPIKYDKQTLAKVPPDECALHFMMAQIANDVATLQKQVLFCFNTRKNERALPVGAARTASGVMLVGFLAGRLYEAWTLLRKPTHSQVYRTYEPDMPEEGRQALAKIKRYFKGDNLVQRIRLKLAFHTDLATVQEAYERLDDDQTFTDYIANHNGNTHYHGAATLNAIAMARLTGETGLAAGLDKIMHEIPPLAGLVNTYVQIFMIVFLERYVGPSWRQAKGNAIRFRAPRLRSVYMPYFCEARHEDLRTYDD